jgi:GTP pyrophosphokinase
LNQLNIDKIKHLRDVDSATDYLYSQIPPSEALKKALHFAIEAHEKQLRKSGEPYIVHPILVASIVASITNEAGQK